jgi:hypothetical protein
VITIDAAASAIVTVATAIAKASTTRSVVTTDTVADGYPLYFREVPIEASRPGSYNIAETRLHVLIDACGEAVETEVGWEVAIFKLIPTRVDVRL